MRASTAIILAAAIAAGCSRHPAVNPTHQVTVYYCRAGTERLVPMQFRVSSSLTPAATASYAVNQLLVGPPSSAEAFVLFPVGTQASVTLNGSMAVVDLRGSIARSFASGGTDEAALFKSLTFTLTAQPGVRSVQVLVAGSKRATLPGGAFELDEPLTRDTFAQ